MKKALAILLALALVAGAVFAEEPAYTLTGSASLTWGFDLDTEAHGFTNTAAAKLTFPLGAKGDTKTGDAITGEIAISEFKVGISATQTDAASLTTTKGAVTAKILFPSNLYLQIASAPSFSINHAQKLSTWVNDDWEDAELVAPELTSAGGFAFGMSGDLNFALKVGSTNTHTATATAATAAVAATYKPVYDDELETNIIGYVLDTEAVDAVPAGADPANDYLIGVDFGYTMGTMAKIAANIIYGAFTAEPATFGFGLKATVTPIEGLSIVLASDVENTSAYTAVIDIPAMTAYDVMFTADYKMVDLFSFGAGAYYATMLPNDLITADNIDAVLDARVRASLLAVPALTLDIGLDMLDLLAETGTYADDALQMLVGAKLAYKAMLGETNYAKPYANVSYSVPSEGMALNVGLDLAVIPLTVFKLDYTAGTVTANTVAVSPISGSEAGNDKGVFKFVTTITY